MVQAQLDRDVYSYNAAISACERAGSSEMAVTLLESMASETITPTVISYNAAL